MKKLILMFLLTFVTILTYGQDVNCDKFKEGTFYYPEVPDYGYTIRNKKEHKSYVGSSNMWVTWKVKWVDDCNFNLFFKSAENNDGVFKKGDKISATIISTEGDCYTFSSIFYSEKYPEGKKMPPGKMCIKKD